MALHSEEIKECRAFAFGFPEIAQRKNHLNWQRVCWMQNFESVKQHVRRDLSDQLGI